MAFDLLSSLITNWYLIIINTIISAIVYQCVIKYWNFFSQSGTKFVRGLPFVGSQYKMILGKISMAEGFNDMYNTFPNERFFGMYELMGTPTYVIRDPELVKQIAIKDFDHFVNHRTQISEESDPLLGRSLFGMRDSRWRDMRSTLSPAFTGSKMRLMLSLVNDCANEFCGYLLETSGGKTETYDLKDLFTRFACDTIATSAFGIKLNSLKDRKNDFFRTGVEVTKFEGIQALKFLLFSSIPNVMKFFKVKFFTDEQTKYFRDLVHGNMSYREENNIVRHDMINLLMQVKKGLLTHDQDGEKDEDIGFATVKEINLAKPNTKAVPDWKDDDFVAQCMIFFLAGFNAVSGGQCFMAHELTVNPDIQQKLYEEISDAHTELNGKPLNFDVLQKMKYMDMVVSETLRRWALGPATDRYVNKPYVIENSDGTKVQLNVGDAVWLPTYALHMDPQYFPNPTKFDPERFNDENKHSIVQGTYMPFGLGPRNCIASRFALMEMKSVFYYLLLNFELVKSDKTPDPLVLKRNTFNTDAQGGFYASLKPRK